MLICQIIYLVLASIGLLFYVFMNNRRVENPPTHYKFTGFIIVNIGVLIMLWLCGAFSKIVPSPLADKPASVTETVCDGK